jgi:putative flavoprotein involved in K+ transport
MVPSAGSPCAPAEQVEVAVIGAGQAGLALGYYLGRRGIPFLILEGANRFGEPWRRRWDSLKLFSPARFSGLPGLPFPAEPDSFPGKDEMAGYLESYHRTFELPVRLDTPVTSLGRAGDRYLLRSREVAYEAKQVVVATGAFQGPYVPSLATQLAPEVFQVHSADYRNPDQLPAGDALVVGGATSGIQIAEELSARGVVYLSVGSRIPRLPRRILGRDLFWWLDKLGLPRRPTVHSPLGRVASRRDASPGAGLRTLRRRHGVRLLGRAESAKGGSIRFGDGAALEPAGVVWATGYRPDFGWIELPVTDERGVPRQRRGVTPQPGLYFLGLRWMYSAGSALIGWVRHDAEFIAHKIAVRASEISQGAR